MNVKKAINKIVALGTGAALMGATVLGAMAANLAEFPAPFVSKGQFNAMVVIGQAAQTPDVIGAVDIATTLQYEMKQAASASSGSASSVVLSGDNVQIDLSADKLGLGEKLGSVIELLEDNDLDALADGKFTGKSEKTYTQAIRLPTGYGSVNWYDDYTQNDKTEGVYLKYTKDQLMYTYELEFSSDVTSDIATSELEDFEDKTIKFMGKSYNIIDTDVSSNDITLTLMGGDANDVIEEYATKTYTVDGKEYSVEATYIGTTNAKFRINGEITDSIAEGETYKLADNTEVGVREILENEAGEGGQDMVEFYLGAAKMVLQDTDVTSTTGAQALEIGDESYDNALVTIEGSTVATEFSLSAIKVAVTANKDYYVGADEKLSEKLTANKDILFGNFDIEFKGLTEPETTSVLFEGDGDEGISMSFTTKGGLDYDFRIWNASTSTGRLGSEDGSLITKSPAASTKNETVNVDDMFVISDGAANPEDVKTRVFQYTGFDAEDKIISIEDVASGDEIEITLAAWSATPVPGWHGSKTIDGKSHTFSIFNDTGAVLSDDMKIWVSLDGTTSAASVPITTASGAYVYLDVMDQANQSNTTPYNYYISTLPVTVYVPYDAIDERTSTQGAAQFNFSLNVATSDADIDTSFGGTAAAYAGFSESGIKKIGDSDDYYALTEFGVEVKMTQPTTGQNTLELVLPFSQKYPQVFVTSGAVASSVVEGASGSAYTVAPINAGIAKLDTEVASSWSSENVIVVGGPCVNTVAASLLGNPADCTAGFEQGKAKIKLFPQGSKVAMLVAGYSADDTRRATKVVHNFRNYASSFKGTELQVAGTSMSDITVTSVQ